MARDFDFIPRRTPMHSARPRGAVLPRTAKYRESSTYNVQPSQSSPAVPHRSEKPVPDHNFLDLRPKLSTASDRQYSHLRHAEVPHPRQFSIPDTSNSKINSQKILNKKTILSTVLLLIGIIIVAGGFLTPLLENPHIAVALYVAIALIFKLKSQTSFSLALLLLIVIPVLIVIKQSALAETYAVFCFYFLVLGVIMATFELRTGHKSTSM